MIQLTMACLMQAAGTYGLPPAILVAIQAVENGRVGAIARNRDGSFDMGPMQVNSYWIPKLAEKWRWTYSETVRSIRDNGCLNMHLGAWILQDCLARRGDLWQAVGCYHSPGNPRLAQAYIRRVAGKAIEIYGPGVFAPAATAGR